MDLVPPPPLAIVLGDVPEGVYPRGSAEKLAVVDVARAGKVRVVGAMVMGPTAHL